ncbi:50S ribosomal protein L18Ae [Candidatus Pyrohabitans sp.]
MEVKTFRIKGKFLMGRQMQPFVWECRAVDVTKAYEKVYSEFGSKHRTKRRNIVIEKVEEIPPEEATKPEIRIFAGVEEHD